MAQEKDSSPRDKRRSLPRGVNDFFARLPWPTHAGWLYLLLAQLIYLQSMREESAKTQSLLVFLAAGLAAMLPVSLLFGWLNLRGVRLKRRSPAVIHVGDQTSLALLVHNPRRWFAAFSLKVRQPELPGIMMRRVPSAVPVVAPGHETRLRQTMIFLRRGNWRLSEMWVESSFPFGLIAWRQRLAVPTSALVYPKPLALPGWLQDRLLGAESRFGEHRRSRIGQDDVFGLREYREGDSLSRIHWRSSARVGRPMLLEMEDMTGLRYRIVLDTFAEQHTRHTRAELERAVSLCAGLVHTLLEGGMSVSFVCGGNTSPDVNVETVPEGRSSTTWHAIMTRLSQVGFSSRPLPHWAGQALSDQGAGLRVVVVTLGFSAGAQASGGERPQSETVFLNMQDAELRSLFQHATQAEHVPTESEVTDTAEGERT